MRHDFPPGGEALDLSGETLIASGDQQHVYAWPGRPDLVIKVVRPGYADEKWTGWRGALKRRRRIGVYASAVRTVTEHLVLRNAGVDPRRHVQEFIGLVETSVGLGLVARAVRDRAGAYAPTLRRLIEEGRWDAAARARLDEFAEWLITSPLAVGDLHLGNLVLGWDADHGERVVMIDGMGDKGFVPINSLSPALNRRHKRARIARLNAAVARRLAARGTT